MRTIAPTATEHRLCCRVICPSTAGMGWHHLRASSAVFVRSRDYTALCGGIMAVFLVVAVGAFLDPTLRDSRDRDWMFWVGALTVRDGSTAEAVEVPEVSGGRRKMEVRLRVLASAPKLPEPSPAGRHRPD